MPEAALCIIGAMDDEHETWKPFQLDAKPGVPYLAWRYF